jgi:hypothetical protein
VDRPGLARINARLVKLDIPGVHTCVPELAQQTGRSVVPRAATGDGARVLAELLAGQGFSRARDAANVKSPQ